MYCMNCGATGQRSGETCSSCHQPVAVTSANFQASEPKVCARCNFINEPKRHYCEFCGERLVSADILYASKAAETAAMADDRLGLYLLLKLQRNPREAVKGCLIAGVLVAILLGLFLFLLSSVPKS